MDRIIENAYRDPAFGLRSSYSLYKHLKPKHPAIKISDVKNWLAQQEAYQVSKPRSNTYNSFLAAGPLEQFQIDLIYMPKSWHNDGYKYVLAYVDVFSKKAAMIPMKDRDASTSAKAFQSVLKKLGTPKSIYSDQGAEFKNNEFQSVLDAHNIQIIFALDHAPFVEAFNKTMKTRLYKYMNFNDSASWSKALNAIVTAYNNTPHSSTGIAPNDINDSNITQAKINMMKRAKFKAYPPIETGDKVRVPVIHKQPKGYKQQWTYETHIVEDKIGNGIYKINNELYPRKELQLVKHQPQQINKVTTRSMAKKGVKDQIGKATNSRLLKEIMDSPNRNDVSNMLGAKRTLRKRL